MKKLITALLGLILASGLALAAATVTVQAGDSLGSIAARYNTSVTELQRLNRLSGINIRVGQVLRLPQASSLTVRSGDSLDGIAKRNGVSVAALRAANGISGDQIRVGQTLKLPSPRVVSGNTSPRVVSGNTSPRVVSSNTSPITVVSGDSLDKIARRAGVSTQALRAANGLTNDNLSIGQVLRLPNGKPIVQPTAAKPSAVKPSAVKPSANTVVVQSGDTLGAIAKRNNTTVEAIQAANNLRGNAIGVGQVLQLRKPVPSPAIKPVARGAKIVVKAGDNLDKIAKRNGVTVAVLRRVNNLSTNNIGIGDILYLPSSQVALNKPKPTVATAKPKPTVSSKPKPTVSSKPKPTVATAKPKLTVSSKPKPTVSSKPKPTVSSKPKPAVLSKPKVAATPKPTSQTVTVAKPSATNPNTRVIAAPPNLPSASSRTVSVKPNPVKPASNVTILAPIPNDIPVSSAQPTAPKPAATVAATPKPAIVAAAPKPAAVAAPSTTEPDEIPVSEDSPLIDPALESPFFDATAPESKPTAPSDLAPEDIVIEIPSNQSAASVTPAPSSTPNAPTYSRTERLLWPLSGTMTSRFGWRSLRGNRYHTGIDLAAPTGTRVYAALSGRVEFAGWNRQGYGYLIIIRGWDNRRYYYGHNSRLNVKRGQWIRQGQIISRVGSTGFSTGPHLHFEIRVGNSARNPLKYLPRSRAALASSKR